MGINKEHKIKLIMEEEYSLAREVALGIIIKKPLKAWLYIIPGIFIVDFLRRGKEIRRYGDHYMFPRKLALESIHYDAESKKMDDIMSGHERSISNRLTALELFSEEIKNMYITLLKFLIGHYQQLIEAEGETFADLVNDAYKDRAQYDAFLDHLSSLERDIDNTIIKSLNSASLIDSYTIGQQQLDIMRNKHADIFF
jgi:hypothetical protein